MLKKIKVISDNTEALISVNHAERLLRISNKWSLPIDSKFEFIDYAIKPKRSKRESTKEANGSSTK